MLLVFCLFSPISLADDKKSHASEKAHFIIEIIQSVNYEESIYDDYYRIGVFGKGAEIKEIMGVLKKEISDISVLNKPVAVYNFKRVRNVAPVDLMFVSGNSKIRLNDLHDKLKRYNYILLTENYPFGTSSLNFTIDEHNEIIYEIQEQVLTENGVKIKKSILRNKNRISSASKWKKRLGLAMDLISSQNQIISEKEQEIDDNKREINEGKKVIKGQNSELNEKSQKIKYQRNIIVIIIISLVLVSILVFSLIKVNLQRKSALIDVENKNKNIEDSLNYAKGIQNVMMPKPEILAKLIKDHFIIFKPKDIVSGDFFWMEKENDKTFFAVADCTGHGVPGALMSIICSYALSKIVKELHEHDPAKILDGAANLLEIYFSRSKETLYDGMDIALVSIDSKANKLEYAGANNSLFYFKNETLCIIPADRQPIGWVPNRIPYTQHSLNLNEIESIYMFSDGIKDQFGGPKNKKYSKARLKEQLISIQDKDMTEQLRQMQAVIEDWKGDNEQTDDICIAGINLDSFKQ